MRLRTPVQLFESAVSLIDEQKIRLGVIGDEYVHPSVIVEIRNADAHPFPAHGSES